MKRFMKACKNGDLRSVQLFLQYPLNDSIIRNNKQAVECATRYNHKDIVHLLLEDGRADPSQKIHKLIEACYRGETEIVRDLLGDSRLDLSKYYNLCLGDATRNGYEDIVILLLEDSRTNPNDGILSAISGEQPEILKLLLRRPDIDRDIVNDHLDWECQCGNLEIVSLLLEEGRADPNMYCHYSLEYAAKGGYIDIVLLLLDHPDIRNNGYHDPQFTIAIKEARRSGHQNIVDLLESIGKLKDVM